MLNLMKGKLIFEGSRKKIYTSNEPGIFILQFKDEEKSLIQLAEHQHVNGSGTLNNTISGFILRKMEELSMPNHFIHQINMREQAVHSLDMFPFTVTLRNYATGDTLQHLGAMDKTRLPRTLIEYHMRSTDTHGKTNNILITPSHLISLGWLHEIEVEDIEHLASRVNDFLTGLFAGARLTFVSATLRFGRHMPQEGENSLIMIGDEITPRACELWDNTLDQTQKHRYLSEIEIADRLGLLPQHERKKTKGNVTKMTPKREHA